MKRRDFIGRDETWKERQCARVRAHHPLVGSFMQAMWWQNETWAEVTHVSITGALDDRVGLITMDGFYSFLLWELKPTVKPRPPTDAVFLSYSINGRDWSRIRRFRPIKNRRWIPPEPAPSPYEQWVEIQVRLTMSS